jgi:hypothetical protein
MKKLLTLMVMVILTFSLMPVVLADGDEVGSGDINIDVDNTNYAPEIYSDPTQRSWYPNDQTYYTAEAYGTSGQGEFCQDYYDVGVRGDYVFTGETVTYYVAVYDENGEDDIGDTILLRDGSGVGSCAQIEDAGGGGSDLMDLIRDTDCDGATDITNAAGVAYVNANFVPTVPYDNTGADANDDLFKFYACTLIVQDSWTGSNTITIQTTDEAGPPITTVWSDVLTMNPPLSLTLTGSIDFGSAQAGETVTSSSVQLNNIGSDGVIMDTYIASDDYFTDPVNPTAICGAGNGIPYDAFSYYATKGAIDSGDNDGTEIGLAGGVCTPDADEYTTMPSHSGDILDMCRILDLATDASFLSQGQSMTLTFQLDVPSPCEGSFTNGEFHFVGRVV